MTYSPTIKSAEWHEKRRATLGGSDAVTVCNGSAEDRLKLWQVKTGAAQPDDLSDVFPVHLGTVTEDLNLWWFAKQTGLELRDEQRVFVQGFRSCTVDGMVTVNGVDAVVEAKHIGERFSMQDAINRYQPQLHHNMIVTGTKRAFLSVIRGNIWDYAEIELDADYAQKVLLAEADFWECVTMKMPPGDAPVKIEAPPPTRVVDMTGSNAWADAAAEWLATKPIAKRFDTAAATLRSLIDADVKAATGHGLSASRNKRGAILIKEI